MVDTGVVFLQIVRVYPAGRFGCKVHQQLIRCCGQDTVLMGLHQLRNSYAMCSDLLFILSDFRVQPGILSLERRDPAQLLLM